MNTIQQRIFSALESRYGSVRQAKEHHGLHFFIPCPVCLKRHGSGEMRKKHLGINVEAVDFEGNTYKCYCNKCGEKFNLKSLLGGELGRLNIPTLPMPAQAVVGIGGPKGMFPASATDLTDESQLITPAGDCLPLSEVPAHHFAITYLKKRNFSIEELERRYRAAWCTCGTPMARSGEFVWSTTNRIILYGYSFGALVTWQARCLDYTDPEGIRWIYGPYGSWYPSSTAEERARKIERDHTPKYLSAAGRYKSQHVINLDVAVEASQKAGFGKTVVLCEGMLDAARIGDSGVPLLGKSLSDTQARLLKAHCDTVLIMLDPDAHEQVESIESSLTGLRVLNVQLQGYKDPGDAPREYLWYEIAKAMGASFPKTQ